MFELGVDLVIFVDILWWMLNLHRFPLIEYSYGAFTFDLISWCSTLRLSTYFALLDLVFWRHTVSRFLEMTIGRYVTTMLYHFWDCLLELTIWRRGSSSAVPVYGYWLLSVRLCVCVSVCLSVSNTNLDGWSDQHQIWHGHRGTSREGFSHTFPGVGSRGEGWQGG